MHTGGPMLLHDLAERIIASYLEREGRVGVGIVSGFQSLGSRGIDITYPWEGGQRKIKVKADPYFGVDQTKIRDRSLAFYREDSGSFALESVANSATREPGWSVESGADEVYYYYLAVAQAEGEVAALLNEADQVLFSEIKVERESLFVIPMRALREWFEANQEEYAPRPVVLGNATAWYRLVPREVILSNVDGVRTAGPILVNLAV